jgi:Pyridoxamine 5'-phosphate oxidase
MATEQRRGRRIAMTSEELDAFLTEERTCRIATVKQNGAPHVSPLWFVWDGSSMWLNSIVKSQRWADIERNPMVSVVVDAGVAYTELCGAELSGSLEPVGEAPRTGEPEPLLTEPERLWAEKYYAGGPFTMDGRHAWLRLTPAKVVSWDFRKLASL